MFQAQNCIPFRRWMIWEGEDCKLIIMMENRCCSMHDATDGIQFYWHPERESERERSVPAKEFQKESLAVRVCWQQVRPYEQNSNSLHGEHMQYALLHHRKRCMCARQVWEESDWSWKESDLAGSWWLRGGKIVQEHHSVKMVYLFIYF